MNSDPSNQNDKVADVKAVNDHIGKVWCLFLERLLVLYPAKVRDCIELNEHILAECTGRALSDLQRMADFHLPDSAPDRHKYAAYLAGGIAHGKPISWRADGFDEETLSVLHYINDLFAVSVFRSFLICPLPHELIGHLIYMLHYRATHAKSLSLIAYMCEQLVMEREKNTQGDARQQA